MSLVPRFAAIALAAGTLFVAPALRAEGPDGPGGMPRLAVLQQRLGLSEDEVTRLKEAIADDRGEMKILRDKVGADLAELEVLVDKNATDEELKAKLDSLESDQKDVRSQQDKRIALFRAVLTPRQQAKLALMLRDRMAPGPDRDGEEEGAPAEGQGLGGDRSGPSDAAAPAAGDATSTTPSAGTGY